MLTGGWSSTSACWATWCSGLGNFLVWRDSTLSGGGAVACRCAITVSWVGIGGGRRGLDHAPGEPPPGQVVDGGRQCEQRQPAGDAGRDEEGAVGDVEVWLPNRGRPPLEPVEGRRGRDCSRQQEEDQVADRAGAARRFQFHHLTLSAVREPSHFAPRVAPAAGGQQDDARRRLSHARPEKSTEFPPRIPPCFHRVDEITPWSRGVLRGVKLRAPMG